MKKFMKRWIVLLALFSYESAIADPNIYTKNAAPGSTTNIPLSSLAAQAANTVVGNGTSGSASPTALAVPSCSAASSALTWTTNTGFGCNTISSTPTFPGTVSGATSGGIPYFSSTTAWASSALLGANQLVFGGGAGTAPFTNSGFSVNTTTKAFSIVNGVDTLTLSADNAFEVTLLSTYGIKLSYGAGLTPYVRETSGTPSATRVVGNSNGMSFSRYGLYFGRHSSNTAAGPGGIAFEANAADDVVGDFLLAGQAAWAQATVNTAGANILVAGGIGRRFFTVVDYTQLGGKTITVIINGTSTTKTEGVNWTAATSNAATATSIAAAFNAVTGLDSNNTVAVGAIAYFAPANARWTYQLDVSTNAIGAAGTVTSGANGQVNVLSDVALTQIAGTAAKKVFSVTAPTVASGGCTSPTAVTSNGTASFSVGVGTSCSGSQPLVFTLPAATTGWNCYARNSTNGATSAPAQTGAVSTTSVTITNFSRTLGTAAAWTDSDNVVVSCMGY